MLVVIMNKIELQKKRNDTARLFKHSSKIHRNCIRLNTGNTLEHERAKFELCWALQQQGKQFITEAETENGVRCDIVVLDDANCIELVKSETKKSIKAKMGKYPLPIIVYEVDKNDN